MVHNSAKGQKSELSTSFTQLHVSAKRDQAISAQRWLVTALWTQADTLVMAVRLTVCVSPPPSNSHIEILPPKVMTLGGRAFWRVEPSKMGLVP